MLKVLGGEQKDEFKAVASGTLPSGKPVVVNSDGTVSVVGETPVTQSAGTPVTFESGNAVYTSVDYDANAQKVVIAYRDGGNSNYGTAVVGTVNASTNSISFGTPVVFFAGETSWTTVVYDANAQKVLIAYQDRVNNDYGAAIVGTVSGTSISFGTATIFSSSSSTAIAATYDSAAQKIVVVCARSAQSPIGVVGTISGTSVSFGSAATYGGTNDNGHAIAYDANADKVVVVYRSGSDTQGKSSVGTVSGTSISFGSEVVYDSGSVGEYVGIAYDASVQKVVVAYVVSNTGYAKVGTVSGSSISYASSSSYSSTASSYVDIAYDSNAESIAIFYRDSSPFYGKAVSGKVSGTSISFSSELTFQSGRTQWTSAAYDTNAQKIVVAYQDYAASTGDAVVFQIGYTATNLTAENYIGMSQGAVTETSEVVGTESVFDTTTFGILDSVSVYDPDTQKTIIAYADRDNGDAVTAVVATVTGTTFSFGTPVVAHAGSDTEQLGIAYDTTNDRVVITYKNVGNSNYGTAVVGQVSGTSITFGTPVVYEAATSSYNAIDFDANSGKVVIAYMDSGNSNYGTAIVGTVSGTSISFGTPVVFNSGVSQYMSTVYDPSSQKTVIVYRDSSVLNRGEALVGTVSGTSISFGSVTLFDSASGHEADNISAAYDPDTQQVIVAYREGASPFSDLADSRTHGRAVVGSVSGTSITFGDPATFNATSTQYIAAGYDTVANKVVVAYRDRDNSDYGTVVAGSISGTSLSFETPVVYSGTDAVIYIGASYNEAAGSFIISYRDMTSLDGTAVAYQAGYITRYPVADGSNVRLDIIGSISDNQLDLTAGEKYYVQTDGTLGTTAGSPSVLAGTAISSTKLLVKT